MKYWIAAIIGAIFGVVFGFAYTLFNAEATLEAQTEYVDALRINSKSGSGGGGGLTLGGLINAGASILGL